MKRITVAMLKRMGACSDEVDTFEREWPCGCAPTKKNILRAQELGLNVDWFMDRALTASARAEFNKAIAPARAEYKKAADLAWAEYKKAIAPAWAEFQKATATVLASAMSNPKNWKAV